MDFFARQDKARKSTKLLVVYFAIAVVCIVVSVYLACLLIFYGATSKSRRHSDAPQIALWDPQVFMFAAGGALAVIVCGSFFKTAQLASGGKAVAESLGGRLVGSNTTDPNERKLINVVEEMAIASGIAVPDVYVMDQEEGINAFAAGHSTNDAVVGVTRGCIQTLSRDELQGVIGHEFSHILNGDMRLNLRLMGIIFGIVCLTVIGRILLRSGMRSSYRLGAQKKGVNPLPLLGLALIIIGWVGVFFGKLIQAAVSRQREFLADASAVQFTRNPDGLSGALQKIGGMAFGSRLESGHAQEASHMFFGNALGSSFLNALATHPPLEERIRAIDPQWDGKFKAVRAAVEDAETPRSTKSRTAFPVPPILGAAAAAGFAPQTVRAQTVMTNLGKPTPMHLRYAEELRDSFPDGVRVAAREPRSAVALIYTMLLSEDETTRATQLKELAQKTPPPIYEKIAALAPVLASVSEKARLPLIELTMPALRQMRADEYQSFIQTLQWLIESDEQLDLFEFVLQKIIRRHLEPQFTKARPAVAQYYTIKPLVPDCAVLLSALALVGHTDATGINKAYQKGAPYLRSADAPPTVLGSDKCGLEQIDAALNRLALAVPQIKKNVIEAAVQVVGADGVIHEHEAELLRAVADTLDCPIPPFVRME